MPIGFRLNLRGSFIVAAMIAIALTAVAVHTPWSWVSNASIDEIAEQLNRDIAESAADQVLNLLESTEAAQRVLQGQLAGGLSLEDKTQRDSALLALVRSQPHFSFASVGTPNGDFFGGQRVGKNEYRAIESRFDAATGRATRKENIYDKVGLKPLRTEEKPSDFNSTKRTWWAAAETTADIGWTDIFIFANTGKLGLNSAMSVKRDGKIINVSSIAIELDRIDDYLSHLDNLRSGVAFIATPKGEVVATNKRPGVDWSQSASQGLRKMSDAPDKLIRLAQLAVAEQKIDFNSLQDTKQVRFIDPDSRASHYITFAPTGRLGWVVGTVIPRSDFYGRIDANQTTLVVTLGLAVFLGVLVVTFAASRVTRPLVACIAMLERLADGDLDARADGETRTDEIGRLARALATFREKLQYAEELQAAQLRDHVARMERLNRVETATQRFNNSMNDVIGVVGLAVQDMEGAANAMAANANQTSMQAKVVEQASSQTSDNVRSVSTATENLSLTTIDIGRQAEEAAQALDAAVNEAQRTNETVRGLAQAASQIGDVVALIHEIASQTNLLALNATIEAARAGEAGRGFAVVASEVKNLASQTARATEEIQSQVKAIQEETGEAVHAITTISKTIDNISGKTRAVVDAVQRQGLATRDIARNAEQAAERTSEVAANIAGVTAAAHETGAAAEQVLISARNLATQSGSLRQEIDHYIKAVAS